MANREDDVKEFIDRNLRADLTPLIDDQITLPFSALCDQLANGKASYSQVRNFRVVLTQSIAEAIRAAVRPLENRVQELES